MDPSVTVRRRTSARIPTPRGAFHLHYYENSADEKEHLALVVGEVSGGNDVLVRIHSECFTGDVLGSLRCDCGDQLDRSIRRIADEGCGVLVYLRQEGRGIGLLDKLRAYNLQDIGYDTVEANVLLGHEPDERDYAIAARVIDDLELRSLRLLTNNPAKIESLTGYGVRVAERVALPPVVHPHNESYLATKAERMRHVLTVAATGGGAPQVEEARSEASADGGPDGTEGETLERNGAPDGWAPLPDEPGVGKRDGTASVREVPDDGGGEGEEAGEEPERSENGGARQRRRPRVTLSYAQSLDGSITTARGRPLTLSGPEALTLTHRLRSRNDALLVGIGTVLADDPRLTVRRVSGSDPRPVVVDSRLRFPPDARMLETDAPAPWILTTDRADPERADRLREAGVRILRVGRTDDDRVDLGEGVVLLGREGIDRLMVEGGARIITTVLRERLADHLVLTVSSTMIGGLSAVGELLGEEVGSLTRLERPRYQWCGEDLVVRGDLAW